MASRLILGQHATALGRLASIAFEWAAPTNAALHQTRAAPDAAAEEDVLEIKDDANPGNTTTTVTRVLSLSRNALRLVGHVTNLMPADEPPLRLFEAEGILDDVYARLAGLGRAAPPPPPSLPAVAAVEEVLPQLPKWEAWLLNCASDAAAAATGKIRVSLAHLGIYALLERLQLLEHIGSKYPALHKLMSHIRQRLKADALEHVKLRVAALRAEADQLEARITSLSVK
jgi:hypothetical protein